MYLETFPVGPLQCNCSILADPQSGDAIIIDPGDEAEKIVRRVTAKGFKVRYLLHTHAHIDHVGATADVKKSLGGEICLHKDDLFLYDNLAMQSQFLGIAIPHHHPVDHYLEDQEDICASDLRVKALYTPGHTPGSMCFTVAVGNQHVVFSGDTLFAGSIGRTDLWGGDYYQIIESIETRLLSLSPETVVITGHGPQTKIGTELRHNPFLQN